MSTPIFHVLTALFIFLLAAVAPVQPTHTKALYNNRPRLRDQKRDNGRHHKSVTDGTHQQNTHWTTFKDDAKDTFEKMDEPLSEEDRTVDSAALWPTMDNFVASEGGEDSNFESKYRDKNYVKTKEWKKSDSQESSHKPNLHSETHTSSNSQSVQRKTQDAQNLTSSEFLAPSEEDDNNTLSNNSSTEHSSSDNKNNTSLRDARCPTCRMREDDRQYRIEHLKQQILSTLRIKNLPNATGVSIPKVPALAHLYEMDSDMMSDSPYRKRNNGYGTHYHDDYDYEEDFIVKTERVFTVARQAPLERQLNLSDSVYFSPPVQLYTSKIKTAHLWFYIRKQITRKPFITVTVDKILPESLPGQRVITKTVFVQKLFRDKAFGWKRIDMRNAVRQWVRHPVLNYGLQIRAEDDAGNNLIVLPPSQEVDKGYEPWLDTKIVEPRSNSRRRRSDALVCNTNSTESRCCRYPLYVGFAEFGWDWIIAPTHVKADYCSGECRMTLEDTTPYSWVNQQMPGTGGSCCTPTKLSALPLLYFDESMNVLYQILQNMKVDKCGCA